METEQREAFKRIGFTDAEIDRFDDEPKPSPYVYIEHAECGHEHLQDGPCPPPGEPCDIIGCCH